MSPLNRSFKACIIGSQGVGKSSIVRRINSVSFLGECAPTVGASFSSVALDVDDSRVRFQIWDTAGQERYRSVISMYYRKTDLAIVVFDITSPESFQELPMWVEELETYVEPEEFVLCILGNKSDLSAERAVDKEKAMNLADSLNALYFETSAKTNKGIREAFVQSARQLLNKKCGMDQESIANGQNSTVPLQSQTSKSSCC